MASNNMRGSETGAALLTVLLLVAVIAVLAASALERLRLATRIASNSVSIEQSRGYALAAETLALTRIDGLLGQDAARVTLLGGWSGRPFRLPVPGGTATATVVDGGNCFNLNGLVTQGPDGVLTYRPASVETFARLMRTIGIPDQTGRPIAAAAADWIDSDSIEVAGGAEDAAYVTRGAGYRTANTLMTDPSELRAVAGVTPQLYAKLRPWVCTLPVAKPSRINVNTLLPEQAPLFVMLLPESIDVARARALLLERPPQGFTSTVEFWTRASRDGNAPGPEAQSQTAVTTQWFSLRIDVALGGTELTQTALIDATRTPARLVSRSWGDPS